MSDNVKNLDYSLSEPYTIDGCAWLPVRLSSDVY